MALETPKWLQAGSYSARLDRHVIEEVFRRQPRVMRGLQVTGPGVGDDAFSINISEGSAVIIGNRQNDQGGYLIRSTGVENIAVDPNPASAQTDSVYAVINDPNAGGPVGDNFEFVYVPAGAGVPADSILLANINRTASDSSIQSSAIVDQRPLGEWSWTVGTLPPTHKAPDGDLYVQVS